MPLVGHAFAVLKGYRPGDPEKEQEFLDSMHPAEVREKNRQDSQVRNKLRKRALQVGSLPRRWNR